MRSSSGETNYLFYISPKGVAESQLRRTGDGLPVDIRYMGLTNVSVVNSL